MPTRSNSIYNHPRFTRCNKKSTHYLSALWACMIVTARKVLSLKFDMWHSAVVVAATACPSGRGVGCISTGEPTRHRHYRHRTQVCHGRNRTPQARLRPPLLVSFLSPLPPAMFSTSNVSACARDFAHARGKSGCPSHSLKVSTSSCVCVRVRARKSARTCGCAAWHLIGHEFLLQ